MNGSHDKLRIKGKILSKRWLTGGEPDSTLFRSKRRQESFGGRGNKLWIKGKLLCEGWLFGRKPNSAAEIQCGFFRFNGWPQQWVERRGQPRVTRLLRNSPVLSSGHAVDIQQPLNGRAKQTGISEPRPGGIGHLAFPPTRPGSSSIGLHKEPNSREKRQFKRAGSREHPRIGGRVPDAPGGPWGGAEGGPESLRGGHGEHRIEREELGEEWLVRNRKRNALSRLKRLQEKMNGRHDHARVQEPEREFVILLSRIGTLARSE